MIIKNVKLYNWKNFQNCDVNLTGRCFIIGANASGKSNFIDALRFLRDIAKLSGGLQKAVEERGGVTAIRCLSGRAPSNISITIELGNPDETHNLWRYHLNFNNSKSGDTQKRVRIIEERVEKYNGKKWEKIIDRTPKLEDEDSETLRFTHLEQTIANKSFRELQTFFQDIEYLNVVPELVRESSSVSYTTDKEDYYGRNILKIFAKLNDRTKKAYLRRMNSILSIAVPQLEELDIIKDEEGIPHFEAKFKHWRGHGAKQQEFQFSDGTIRLIGFLFSLMDSKDVVLLEEPEINLHTAIISQIPAFIARVQREKKRYSQALITTHSYELLSDSGISPNEVLVLYTGKEGTVIKQGGLISDIRNVVDAGISIAEAVMAITKPENITYLSQLSLFE